MPAGTEPPAPKATMAFAGTGTTGPGRNSRAALARCGSMSQLAVFITDQTPLKLGWPPTRSIAPAGLLCAAAAGAAAAGAPAAGAADAAKLGLRAASDPPATRASI